MNRAHPIRTSLLGLGAALIFAACMPLAHATAITDGTLNFTVTSGSPAPTGSFVWNGTTNTWNSFLVNWDGATYNFLGSNAVGLGTLSDIAPGGTWCGAAASAGGRCEAQIFQLFGPGTAAVDIPETFSFSDLVAFADGSYTVTETSAVPEPSPLGMMLLGLGLLGGLVFFTRRSLSRPCAARTAGAR